MNIIWYGQSCFRIETKEASLLVDPFSKDIGLKPPRLNDNIIAVTHDHYDHANLEGADQQALIIRGPGEYEKFGIYVHGIRSFHDDKDGTERGLNTIFMIRAEEMILCHLGDFGQKAFTDEQLSQMGNKDIDILFIPVGGKYTIGAKEAVEIIKELEPKIIIPMHYKVPGLNIDIANASDFIKELGLKFEEVETFKINKKNLPIDDTKLIIMKI